MIEVKQNHNFITILKLLKDKKMKFDTPTYNNDNSRLRVDGLDFNPFVYVCMSSSDRWKKKCVRLIQHRNQSFNSQQTRKGSRQNEYCSCNWIKYKDKDKKEEEEEV
jgi:hypothetical protein